MEADTQPIPRIDPDALIAAPLSELLADGFSAEDVAILLGIAIRRERRYVERCCLDLRRREEFLRTEAENASAEVAAELRGQADGLIAAMCAVYDAVRNANGVSLGGPLIGNWFAAHLIAENIEDGIRPDGHPVLLESQTAPIPERLWDELGIPNPAPPVEVPEALRPGLDQEAYRAGLAMLIEGQGHASPWTIGRDSGLDANEQQGLVRFVRGEVRATPLDLIERVAIRCGLRPEGIKRIGYASLSELFPLLHADLLEAGQEAEQ